VRRDHRALERRTDAGLVAGDRHRVEGGLSRLEVALSGGLQERERRAQRSASLYEVLTEVVTKSGLADNLSATELGNASLSKVNMTGQERS
jgi:hypothetical protein